MTSPPRTWPAYSSDLWDFMPDAPQLPDRQSRDALVERARLDPAEARRLRLWDYFFRWQPEQVGVPLQKERAQLEAELARGREANDAELARCARDFDRLAEEARRNEQWRVEESTRLEREERARWAIRQRQRTLSGAVCVVLAVGIGALGAASKGCFGCSLAFALPLAAGGLYGLGAASRAAADRAVARRIAAGLAEVERASLVERQRIEQAEQAVRREQTAAGQAWRGEEPELVRRVAFLRRSITDLVRQIPPPPTDQEVYCWLAADLHRLKNAAIRESGLRDRLASILNGRNPLVIRAPAKLQRGDELLPPSYLKPEEPEFRFLQAERFGTLPNGDFADFYALYSIAFILFGEDVLSIVRVVYDFIEGRQMGEISKEVHYLDVVAIESRKGYREIPRQGDKPLLIPNVPSLRVSLPNNEILEVSFPDEAYFREVESFASSRWRSDPKVAAENAIKSVREKLDVAKKSLQTDPDPRDRDRP